MVIDRFEIILQIFSKRASTPLAKASIGLAYLNYIKTRVGSRGGMGIQSFKSFQHINIFNPEF